MLPDGNLHDPEVNISFKDNMSGGAAAIRNADGTDDITFRAYKAEWNCLAKIRHA